ncbi:MAG: methylated-DNA--[protein]-cysteine S-methyltransferase [Hydrogeniiclostridium mannosilyticum]
MFRQTRRWLDRYFGGEAPDLPRRCGWRSSPFRLAVWDRLLKIPYGKVLAYGEIAAALGEESGRWSRAAQAVGGAVGHNPISIIVPCHRVAGSGGSLTGYAGGIDKKRALLALEGVDLRSYFVPKKGTAL